MFTLGRALMTGLILSIAGLGSAGCGPMEYITYITFEASHAVAEAKGVHADRLAPYEYTAAVEYLHKARELGGFSRYHQSVDFGKRARDFGHQAVEISRGKAQKPAEEKHE
jgi:Domain of unknown function (DUF4398)